MAGSSSRGRCDGGVLARARQRVAAALRILSRPWDAAEKEPKLIPLV